MTPVSVQAFIHEYWITFAIAVDAPAPDSTVPVAMAAYQMRSTPRGALIDRHSRLRWHRFGQVEDMAVGAAIASLLNKTA